MSISGHHISVCMHTKAHTHNLFLRVFLILLQSENPFSTEFLATELPGHTPKGLLSIVGDIW